MFEVVDTILFIYRINGYFTFLALTVSSFSHDNAVYCTLLSMGNWYKL